MGNEQIYPSLITHHPLPMLKERFPFLEEVRAQIGDSWCIVPSDKLMEVCKILRDEYKFDCLSCLTGTDRGEFLEVVYHIFSYEKKETIVLKVRLDKVGGFVPSVSSIWPSANWMEREAYDLLGINFTGHPDLRRIMLPDDWTGHPLRKDYKEEAEYRGMSTVR